MTFKIRDSGPYSPQFPPVYFALIPIWYSVFFSRLSRVTDVSVVVFVLVSPALTYAIKYLMTTYWTASTGGVIDIVVLWLPTCLTVAVGFFIIPTHTISMSCNYVIDMKSSKILKNSLQQCSYSVRWSNYSSPSCNTVYNAKNFQSHLRVCEIPISLIYN